MPVIHKYFELTILFVYWLNRTQRKALRDGRMDRKGSGLVGRTDVRWPFGLRTGGRTHGQTQKHNDSGTERWRHKNQLSQLLSNLIMFAPKMTWYLGMGISRFEDDVMTRLIYPHHWSFVTGGSHLQRVSSTNALIFMLLGWTNCMLIKLSGGRQFETQWDVMWHHWNVKLRIKNETYTQNSYIRDQQ